MPMVLMLCLRPPVGTCEGLGAAGGTGEGTVPAGGTAGDGPAAGGPTLAFAGFLLRDLNLSCHN